MAQLFTTRIRHVQLTLSPFTAEDMQQIGEEVLVSITDRIRRAQNVNDSPAKPLNVKYAERKQRGSGNNSRFKHAYVPPRNPIRDWFFRGVTLNSAKVKSASEERVTIGFTLPQADKIVSAQQRRDVQWGVSPKDHEVLEQAIRTIMQKRSFIQVHRDAWPAWNRVA